MSADPEAEKRAAANFNAMRANAKAIATAVRGDLPPPTPIYDEAVIIAVAGDPGRAQRLNAWWARHGGVTRLTPPWLSDQLGLFAADATARAAE